MKGFALGLFLFAATVPTAALASGALVASLPSPTTNVTGVVEVRQPDCDCAPIVVLVDGNQRTLVSAEHPFLRTLAKHAGETVTLEGSLETYTNEETGAVKYVLTADQFLEASVASAAKPKTGAERANEPTARK